MNPLAQLDPILTGTIASGVVLGVAVLAVIVRLIRRAVRAGNGPRLGFGLAVVIAAAVAVIGGVTSFDAVAHRFNSPLIPLVADGMVIACTALRLAAMTRGWRIPGAMLTTYVFIAGSVIINMASVEGWAAKLGHALAPLAYAVLVEMLAYLLRLHMRLTQPARARLSALTLITSPVITTRVWLHLTRTGQTDPVAARALIQQIVRMESRLAAVCPTSPSWVPVGRARAARSAALHTIRDGLLTAAKVAAMLPDGRHLSPADLLALIDRAALDPDTSRTGKVELEPGNGHLAQPAAGPSPAQLATVSVPTAEPVRAYVAEAVHPTASESASGLGHESASVPAPAAASESSAPAAPDAPTVSAPDAPASSAPMPVVSAPPDSDDAALVAYLHDYAERHNDGVPLAKRHVQRLLSSGWSKAQRIHALTGWTDPEPDDQASTDPKQERQLQLLTIPTDQQFSDSRTEREESRA